MSDPHSYGAPAAVDHPAPSTAPPVVVGTVHEFGTGEFIAPFSFRLGTSPVIVVQEPDAGTAMDAEESPQTRVALQLLLGAGQYDTLEEHLLGVPASELRRLVRAILDHFGLGREKAEAVNRADRRRAARQRR